MDTQLPPASPSSPLTCPCPICKSWRLSQAASATAHTTSEETSTEPAWHDDCPD